MKKPKRPKRSVGKRVGRWAASAILAGTLAVPRANADLIKVKSMSDGSKPPSGKVQNPPKGKAPRYDFFFVRHHGTNEMGRLQKALDKAKAENRPYDTIVKEEANNTGEDREEKEAVYDQTCEQYHTVFGKPEHIDRIIEGNLRNGDKGSAYEFALVKLAAKNRAALRIGEKVTPTEIETNNQLFDQVVLGQKSGDVRGSALALAKFLRRRNEKIVKRFPEVKKRIEGEGRGKRVMMIYGGNHEHLAPMFASSNQGHEVWAEGHEKLDVDKVMAQLRGFNELTPEQLRKVEERLRVQAKIEELESI